MYDTIIAAAIAQFQGEDNHRELVDEIEREYNNAMQAWTSLQSASPAALT